MQIYSRASYSIVYTAQALARSILYYCIYGLCLASKYSEIADAKIEHLYSIQGHWADPYCTMYLQPLFGLYSYSETACKDRVSTVNRHWAGSYWLFTASAWPLTTQKQHLQCTGAGQIHNNNILQPYLASLPQNFHHSNHSRHMEVTYSIILVISFGLIYGLPYCRISGSTDRAKCFA